jgi:hypothetical protein
MLKMASCRQGTGRAEARSRGDEGEIYINCNRKQKWLHDAVIF